MKKFVVIYYAPATAMEAMANATPEQMEEGMKPWMEWAAKAGDRLVDLGTPLGNGISVSAGGTPSTKQVNGYSILQAESIEEAHELLKDHPHLGWAEGCDIEVYETMPLPVEANWSN